MTMETQATGERGERVAEMWLIEHGWQILQRRFRSGHRDIDLIATRDELAGRVVAFVEVKARKSASFGGPVAAVGWKKQRELCRSAQVWIARFGRPGDCYRFDVVGVLITGNRIRVNQVENAFLVPSRA